MSDPVSYFVEFEYQYENGTLKKYLKYLGNEDVIVGEIYGSDEGITIRILREMLESFLKMIG